MALLEEWENVKRIRLKEAGALGWGYSIFVCSAIYAPLVEVGSSTSQQRWLHAIQSGHPEGSPPNVHIGGILKLNHV